MNDDDLTSLLRASLAESGTHRSQGPDPATVVRRVRTRRRRRAVTAFACVAASLALVTTVVWQSGALRTAPIAPAAPSSAQASLPSPVPTPSEPDEPGDWSEALFPQCGASDVTLPARSSQLQVTGLTTEPVNPESFLDVEITNVGTTDIGGYAMAANLVLLDAGGTVVATVDPSTEAAWGVEDVVALSVLAGGSVSYELSPGWTSCAGDLPDGAYTAYVLVTVGDLGETDQLTLQQAQGGPFDLVIDSSASDGARDAAIPAGAVPFGLACGAPWQPPDVRTGATLQLPVGFQSSPDDGETIPATLTAPTAVAGSVYGAAYLVRDGVIVATATPSHPDRLYASPGASAPVGFLFPWYDCSAEQIGAGDYELFVVAQFIVPAGAASQDQAIAISDPMPFAARQ